MAIVNDLRVESIVVGKRLRPVNDETVSQLAESMAVCGLINPITITRNTNGIVPKLVAGAHRLEAAKRLGWETIACLDYAGQAEDDRKLIEIDENLVRVDLSAAERAMHVATRKEIYERLYPETTVGATGRGGKKDLNLRSFVDDTAKRTGRGKATVARDATRARGIPQIADVIGTPLDNGAELDALRKLSHDQQAKLIADARSGLPVSAQAFAKGSEPAVTNGNAGEMTDDEAARAEALVCGQVKTLRAVYMASRPEARRRFKAEIEHEDVPA